MKILTSFSAVLLVLQVNAQNLVDSSDWVSGTSGTTTNWNMQGTTAQNSRITMAGPYGNQVTVWQAAADGSSGMNGGLWHKGVDVNTSKTYRVSFWVHSDGPNNCTNHTGFIAYYTTGGIVQPFQREDGSNVTWPYFSGVNQPNNKWFLVVAYLRPSSANDLGDSGLYDPSLGNTSNLPAPSYTASDFIFPSNVSEIDLRIRSFMWSCAAGEKMFVYDPKVEEMPNATPLATLLYGSTPNDNQPPTSPTLSSSGQTQTTVDLTWATATDNVGVTGYKIFQNGTAIATLGAVSNHQVTGLTANTTYNFTATALDAAGNESIASNVVAITTDSGSGSSGGSGESVWSENNAIASYDGKVQVGAEAVPGDYKMAVDGKLITEEVKVQLSGDWPDYVFKDGYHLPSLSEIKKHIQEKGHLPNMPSAKEVEAEGLELGEMNRLLLEKIEELTLYILLQENRLDHQQKQIDQLKKQ